MDRAAEPSRDEPSAPMIPASVARVEIPIDSTDRRVGTVTRFDDGEARNGACAESATTTHREQRGHVR
jgi:hypothetical protein